LVAVWRSGDGAAYISKVTLHRARLVLFWVTVLGYTVLVYDHPPRLTQPPALSGMRNEYRPKCGDALRLRSYSGMAHSTCRLNTWVANCVIPR